jgi:8-oxo-dGTP diphosphatase
MKEYFDVCTIDRNLLGKVCERGSKLNENEYHIVAMAILINNQNKILLTRRSKNKTSAGMWECTAGSVLAGEKSRDAIIREIKEELGIKVEIKGQPISEYTENDAIFDLWMADNIEYKIDDLTLQKEEVDEAGYKTLNEIKDIIKSGTATKCLNEIVKLNNIGLIKLKEN